MTKNSSSMVARWYIALQEFDYTLHFVKGSQNTIADAMSRLCPNLTELALPSPEPAAPTSGHPLAALRTVPLASDDQLEALEMCHNALVGHGGADRTVAKLISLDHNWQYMSRRSSVTAHVARRWTAFAYPSTSTITSPRRTHLSKSLTSTTLVPFRTQRTSLSLSAFLLDGWNSIGAKTQPPFGRVIASYSILGVSAPQA